MHIAPLNIHKLHSPSSSSDMTSDNGILLRDELPEASSTCRSQITPPATPDGIEDDQMCGLEDHQPVFHNFLRANYPFQPTDIPADSTVTLPLNQGDVVLVHSIHINGWADGTLLLNGSRGWLPTNYCGKYDEEYMRGLLKALLTFWELLQSGVAINDPIFSNQEFMRGIIGGVRYLLERSNCLTRDSPMVLGNDALRRNRKALLSDLSSLVKTSKRLQEQQQVMSSTEPDAFRNDVIDEMLLKAFKILTRGVRFLDAFLADPRSQHITKRAPTMLNEHYDPSTPPADTTSFEPGMPESNAGSRRVSGNSTTSGMSGSQGSQEQTKRSSHKRTSAVYSPNTKNTGRHSMQSRRLSTSRRLSIVGPYTEAQRQNFVSELLSSTHECLISCLASLIGRLNLSSTSKDLVLNIRQVIAAGKSLGKIIESVCAHDVQTEASLEQVRDTMYQCINQLIVAARECVRPISSDEDDIMMPRDYEYVKAAATSFVIAAGECVTKAKSVIEIVGDFELEPSVLGIDFSLSGKHAASNISSEPIESVPLEPATRPPPPPSAGTLDHEKPLPDVPESEEPAGDIDVVGPKELGQEQPLTSSNNAKPVSIIFTEDVPIVSDDVSERTLDPSCEESFRKHSIGDSGFLCSARSDSIAVSTQSSSTYMSSMRDSETSMISQSSTRATTPDLAAYNEKPYYTNTNSSVNSIADSQATMGDDIDEAETRLLERTFAHELLFNKERQVTGGSLPALVERLTAHDSTPDSVFVSTFYLTFRLFATPVAFAEALVDRFDYVAESPHIAAPVRLRVYNVFKGWLESHWRNLQDEQALPTIQSFAADKLLPMLPAAGKRILELATKVSSTDRPLVPRLVSSMGKTSTSIAPYVSADTPLPAPMLSKSQSHALKVWKMGGNAPSILDFTPLELARQFTIKEMNIFSTIMPDELLASEWMKKTGSNAVNVKAMITLSTDLSNLVADSILESESDAKKRAVLIKHWIKIASRCLELNNYDSLMAIICSLNSSMITRLKKSWDMVSNKRKDELKVLQELVEPTKNHAVLRQRLHDHVPPCLPFVGTYLTDLTFVDIGNPSTKTLPGCGGDHDMTVVNFDKHCRTAKIIGELQRFQIPYRLVEVPELQEWIQAQIVRVRSSADSNNVQQYYRKSLLLEPRLTSQKTSSGDAQESFTSQITPTIPIKEKFEKFDFFSWTHSKDKATLSTTAS